MKKAVTFQFSVLGAALLLCALTFAGCKIWDKIAGIIETVQTEVHGVEGVIDDAIEKIGANSEDWQSILEEALDDLPDAERQVKADMELLIQRGVSHIGLELRCDISYLGDMLTNGLRKIKADFLGQPAPQILPFVCSFSPPAIDMNLAPNSRNTVYVYGYNFDLDPMKLYHRKTGGVRENVSQHFNYSTPFQKVINLGATGIVLGAQSEALEVEFGGMVLTIPVIQAYPDLCKDPWEKTVAVSPKKVIPQKIGEGDNEFSGHGPCIVARAVLGISPDRRQLTATYLVWAYECPDDMDYRRSDYTECRINENRVLFTAAEGEQIREILGPTSARLEYIDRSTAEDRINDTGLVHTWTVMGDTNGDDIGDTYVIIDLNPVRLLMEETGDCITEEELEQMAAAQQISLKTSRKVLELKPQYIRAFKMLKGVDSLRVGQ
jgi:hypothetical protein